MATMFMTTKGEQKQHMNQSLALDSFHSDTKAQIPKRGGAIPGSGSCRESQGGPRGLGKAERKFTSGAASRAAS